MKPIKIKEIAGVIDSTPEKKEIIERCWEKQVLTTEEVASLFGTSVAQVLRLVKESGLPCKKDGFIRLFSFYQIVKWVESNGE